MAVWPEVYDGRLLNEWTATSAVACVTLLDYHSFLRTDTNLDCGSSLNASRSPWTSQAPGKRAANITLEIDSCSRDGVFTHRLVTMIWIDWSISIFRNSRYRQTLPFTHSQLSHTFEQQIHYYGFIMHI